MGFHVSEVVYLPSCPRGNGYHPMGMPVYGSSAPQVPWPLALGGLGHGGGRHQWAGRTPSLSFGVGHRVWPAAPLMTPSLVYQGYLSNIMTSVLKNGLPWTRMWLGQILSTLAWLQVMLLFGYWKTVAVRAIHKGIHQAYETSQHAVQATVKCLHSVVHHMPAKRCIILSKVRTWLNKHTFWDGNCYTSTPRAHH